MLDRVDAGSERHLHALGALDVRHHRHAQLVGNGAGCRGDLGGHAQHAGLPGLLGIKDAARHEQLDDVGAMGVDVAHHVGRLLGRLRHLGKEAGPVTARHGDARARGHDARTHALSRLDGVAHRDVAVERVARAANGGDAARKLVLGRATDDAMQDGAANGVVELLHERAGIARAHRLARAAEVHVHVDESGHEVGAAQVDGAPALRYLGDCGRLDAGDLAVLDGHGHVALWLHVLGSIENRCVDEQRRTRISGHGGSLSLVVWS